MFSFICQVVLYVVLGWIGYKKTPKVDLQNHIADLKKDKPLHLFINILFLGTFLIIMGLLYVIEFIIDRYKTIKQKLHNFTKSD